MKSRTFKTILSQSTLSARIQHHYNQQVLEFQFKHNLMNPSQKIWRHILCRRAISFLINGNEVAVIITVVRFVYARSTTTFTFYGSLLLPRTHYSFPLLKRWIGMRPAMLSQDVENRWISFMAYPDFRRISGSCQGA